MVKKEPLNLLSSILIKWNYLIANGFVKEHTEKQDFLHGKFTINKVSTSVTCSSMDFHKTNELRALTEQEIRSMIYSQV